MLQSLSSRLLLAFAFVIVLSLALSTVGTLFLLRDQEREEAEERVGRLAEPITLAVALLEQAGVGPQEVRDVLLDYADSFDVRILLVDGEGVIVADTESSLVGETVDVFSGSGASEIQRGDSRFRMVSYDGGDEDLLLFAPAAGNIEITANRLTEIQGALYRENISSPLDERVAMLLSEPEVVRIIPNPSVRPLFAVPEQEITSAWRDLIPQLAIAGGAALFASAAAAVLISRSISRPLARITRAAQEMARGEYEQELDLSRDDEIGRLTQAFNAMARQVSHSHQMMRDLLANVSHELKTPLTSIQGFSQAMQDGALSQPGEFKDAGRIINEEAQRMRRLVDDLIELSRLESGQAGMEREPVDLAETLRTCARRFDRSPEEPGAGVRLALADLPELRGDGRRLEQVFSNLIENAVRHTPEGGTVTVGAASANGHVTVTVHNTGSYIPPEEQTRVFERFYQMDRNRSSGFGGSGLGLAIASEVVTAHHGEIQARSDRDTGTEFIVTLPLDSGGDERTVNGA